MAKKSAAEGLEVDDAESIPTLTYVFHQSIPAIPTAGRRPSYPETIATRNAEEQRVFVGPVKLDLPFKVDDVQVRVSNLSATTLAVAHLPSKLTSIENIDWLFFLRCSELLLLLLRLLYPGWSK